MIIIVVIVIECVCIYMFAYMPTPGVQRAGDVYKSSGAACRGSACRGAACKGEEPPRGVPSTLYGFQWEGEGAAHQTIIISTFHALDGEKKICFPSNLMGV